MFIWVIAYVIHFVHAKDVVEEFTSLIEHEIECDKANTFLGIPKYRSAQKKK